MKRFTLVRSLALGAMVLSLGVTQAMAAVSRADEEFAAKAAEGGQAEVSLGHLATENAGSPRVRAFGERMVNDHTQANQALEEIARHQELTLPNRLTSADRATEERLRPLRGGDFDRAYIGDMVQDHRQNISDFRKEAETGQDPALKEFARKYLPMLEQHLQLAEAAETK